MAEEAGMLPSLLQQYSSQESTLRLVKFLMDIYESCNTAIFDPKYYEETSKKLSKSTWSSNTTRSKKRVLMKALSRTKFKLL